MTEYLLAARAAVIFWTNLTVKPAVILFRCDRSRIGTPRRRAMNAAVGSHSLRGLFGAALLSKRNLSGRFLSERTNRRGTK
jgi:hypothetical protein